LAFPHKKFDKGNKEKDLEYNLCSGRFGRGNFEEGDDLVEGDLEEEKEEGSEDLLSGGNALSLLTHYQSLQLFNQCSCRRKLELLVSVDKHLARRVT
jgi:hypothetical protein